MKHRNLIVALMLALSLVLVAGPASAATRNFLVSWTLPTADQDGSAYTAPQIAAMVTDLYSGLTSPPAGTPYEPLAGATSGAVSMTGSAGTHLYFQAQCSASGGAAGTFGAKSAVFDYTWPAALPAAPTINSVTRQ